MRSTKTLIAAFGAALFLTNATPSQAAFGVGAYIKDRFHDTLDLFRVRAGFPNDGKAIGAKARVTTLAQVGYVHFDGTYVGMDRRGVGIVDERRREAGVSVFYGSFNDMVAGYGNGFLKEDTPWAEVEDRRILRNLPHWDDGRQRYLSVGGELATPLFAVDLGVYPEEALDLVLGVFMIDIFNDDEQFEYDMNVYQKATTPGGPDAEGPFRAKRAANEAFKSEMELKAAMELVDSISAADSTTDAAGSPSLPPVDTESETLITMEAADAAMLQLQEAETMNAVEVPAPIEEMDTTPALLPAEDDGDDSVEQIEVEEILEEQQEEQDK